MVFLKPIQADCHTSDDVTVSSSRMIRSVSPITWATLLSSEMTVKRRTPPVSRFPSTSVANGLVSRYWTAGQLAEGNPESISHDVPQAKSSVSSNPFYSAICLTKPGKTLCTLYRFTSALVNLDASDSTCHNYGCTSGTQEGDAWWP